MPQRDRIELRRLDLDLKINHVKKNLVALENGNDFRLYLAFEFSFLLRSNVISKKRANIRHLEPIEIRSVKASQRNPATRLLESSRR